MRWPGCRPPFGADVDYCLPTAAIVLSKKAWSLTRPAKTGKSPFETVDEGLLLLWRERLAVIPPFSSSGRDASA